MYLKFLGLIICINYLHCSFSNMKLILLKFILHCLVRSSLVCKNLEGFCLLSLHIVLYCRCLWITCLPKLFSCLFSFCQPVFYSHLLKMLDSEIKPRLNEALYFCNVFSAILYKIRKYLFKILNFNLYIKLENCGLKNICQFIHPLFSLIKDTEFPCDIDLILRKKSTVERIQIIAHNLFILKVNKIYSIQLNTSNCSHCLIVKKTISNNWGKPDVHPVMNFISFVPP
uniref:Uncharacterized protein n=1 Tax=Heterorhabditis bacteriophora TaxID=37862 RepID=A0A1I7WKM2_HETBA